jgi:hypothetical protein
MGLKSSVSMFCVIANEPHPERRQFLNAFDGGGYAPPPSVELPHEHYVEAAHTSVFE